MSYTSYLIRIGAPIDGSLQPVKPRDLQTKEKPRLQVEKPIKKGDRNETI